MKLSCRKETVRLLRGSVLAQSAGRGHSADIIGHFNRCDVLASKVIEFGETTPFKVI